MHNYSPKSFNQNKGLEQGAWFVCFHYLYNLQIKHNVVEQVHGSVQAKLWSASVVTCLTKQTDGKLCPRA